MEISHHDTRVQNVCLVILTGVAITYLMQTFSAVLIPFVLAIFLTYCLTPFIELQIRVMRFPRYLAIITTILLGCVGLLLIALLVSGAIAEMTQNFKVYQAKLTEIFGQAVIWLNLDRFGIEHGQDITDRLLSITTEAATTIFTGIANSIRTIVSNGLLVVIFMIFMISGKNVAKKPTGGMLGEVEASIKRYSITMVLTSAVTGILVGLTFVALKVDFAWMFGFLAFLLNFIPSIGSIIATLLPIPVIFLSELAAPAQFAAVLIPALIQFGIGNLLQPKLMGQSLNLHPVTILMSLMFFGAIWGVIGMLLATPVTAVLRMLLEKFDYTRSAAMIMAGNLDTITK